MTRRLIAAVCFAVWTTVSTVHAIKVSEASGSDYEPCSKEELAPVADKIAAESDDCAARASYDWNGKYRPTTLERQELCACKLLISKLQTVTVPHCAFHRYDVGADVGGFYSYQDLLEFAFGLCSTRSTSSSTTTTTTTTTTAKPAATAAPTPTATPWYYNAVPTYTPVTYAPTYTYSPSFDLDTSTSSSSKKSKSKAGVIVGIVVAAAVVAAIAAFVVRRNKQKKQGAMVGGQGSSHKRSDGHDVDAHVAHVSVAVEESGELSPLGGGDATYAPMPPSPSAPQYKTLA